MSRDPKSIPSPDLRAPPRQAADIDLPAVDDFCTLLTLRARSSPDEVALIYLGDGENESARETFAELDAKALAVAARLRLACAPAARVILLSESSTGFVAAFFGCLYAGRIAVPCHVPRAREGLERLERIAADAGAAAILAPSRVIGALQGALRRSPALASLPCIAIEDAIAGPAECGPAPAADPDAIAFLQYTSGSTGEPKGVAVSHRNLIANERMIREAFLHSPQSLVVGWLPLYHDMGLIGNLLQPLYAGFTSVLMPPVAAIQKPMRVIRAVAKYRATSCGGPNFFFDLCVRKFSGQELEAGGVPDLSSWIRAFNGSEPVRAQTIDAFCRLYGAYGFRRSSFYPCYGLAEATLFVSGAAAQGGPRVLRLAQEALARDRALAAADRQAAVAAVSCGAPAPGQRIAIVAPGMRRRCAEGAIGEIWISGPSVAQGYWNDAAGTARVFRARLADEPQAAYLRTGDLGFLDRGELVITGRLKDLIIVHGRNHYPQDIERTVESSHHALRPGGGAAFTVGAGEAERLCVVHEVKREALRRIAEREVLEAARVAVARAHGLRLSDLVLVAPGAVARTSSGKIRRGVCRRAYLEGALAPGRKSLETQTC